MHYKIEEHLASRSPEQLRSIITKAIRTNSLDETLRPDKWATTDDMLFTIKEMCEDDGLRYDLDKGELVKNDPIQEFRDVKEVLVNKLPEMCEHDQGAFREMAELGAFDNAYRFLVSDNAYAMEHFSESFDVELTTVYHKGLYFGFQSGDAPEQEIVSLLDERLNKMLDDYDTENQFAKHDSAREISIQRWHDSRLHGDAPEYRDHDGDENLGQKLYDAIRSRTSEGSGMEP